MIIEELRDALPAGATRVSADQLSQLPMGRLEQVETRLNREMEAEISAQVFVCALMQEHAHTLAHACTHILLASRV